ncbi:MAG: alpha/beta fold hydrolase, partial [Gammaproteobacteria bacterium]
SNLLRTSLKFASQYDLEFVDAIPHRQLNMPKLVLWGENDLPLRLSWGRELYDLLPEPKSFVAIANCGIFPHEERPAVWLSAVLDFLDQPGANLITRARDTGRPGSV